MNTNYTDITILLDRSGSMSSIKQVTLDGLNSFISEQKKAPEELELNGRRITLSLDEANPVACRLTLIQFACGAYIKTIDAADINYVQMLTEADYRPVGGTPLIASFCRAIDETGVRLAAMPEADRPGRVIFLAITDGQETEFTVPKQTLKDKIQLQEKTYKWQFIYQGANQDAISEAHSYGIQANNTLNYAASYAGTTRSFNSASNLVSSKRFACCSSDMSSVGYTVQDRLAQNEELAKIGKPASTGGLDSFIVSRMDALRKNTKSTKTPKP